MQEKKWLKAFHLPEQVATRATVGPDVVGDVEAAGAGAAEDVVEVGQPGAQRDLGLPVLAHLQVHQVLSMAQAQANMASEGQFLLTSTNGFTIKSPFGYRRNNFDQITRVFVHSIRIFINVL